MVESTRRREREFGPRNEIHKNKMGLPEVKIRIEIKNSGD